jgi:hypothetical protein
MSGSVANAASRVHENHEQEPLADLQLARRSPREEPHQPTDADGDHERLVVGLLRAVVERVRNREREEEREPEEHDHHAQHLGERAVPRQRAGDGGVGGGGVH